MSRGDAVIDLTDQLLAPPETISFNSVIPVSFLESFRVKISIFVLLYVLTVAIYAIKTSLTLQKVDPPAFNASQTMTFHVVNNWEQLLDLGFNISIIYADMVFFDSVTMVTNCGGYDLIASSPYIAYVFGTLNPGCTANVTVNYSPFNQMVGEFNMFSLNGFYFQGEGDLTLVSSGYVDYRGQIQNLVTQQEIKIISGSANGQVYYSSRYNQFYAYEFNYIQIFNFALSVQSVLWKVLGLFVVIYQVKLRHQTNYGRLFSVGNKHFIEK